MKKNTKTDATIEKIKDILKRVNDPYLAYFFINLQNGTVEFTEHILKFLSLKSLVYPNYHALLRELSSNDAQRVESFFKQVRFGKNQEPSVEFKVQYQEQMPLWLRCTPTFSPGSASNAPFFSAVLENITDEINNQLIIDSCLDGTYVGNLAEDTAVFSGKLIEQLSIKSGYNTDVTPNYRKLIYPEDLPHYDRYLSHLADNFSDKKIKTSCIEYRVRDIHGNPIWISNRNQVFYDEDNNPSLIVGGYININELQNYNQFVQTAIETCDVTGLPNRYRLSKDVRQHSAKFGDEGYVVLIYTNMNDVSSALEYDMADIFLKELAIILQQNAPENSALYRTDPDCFALLLPERSVGEVQAQMLHYQTVCGAPLVHEETHYSYSISTVALSYQTDSLETGELFQRCSIALKKLKMGPNKQSLLFEGPAFQDYQEKASLENTLRKCVAEGMSGFFVVYQPFIQVEDNRFVGVEALLRWRDASGRIVSPGEFIPILENSGLMDSVGEWVFKTACNQCKDWLQKGFYSDFYVSINATTPQLLKDHFTKSALRHLKKIKLPAQNVIIEITESMLMLDFQRGLKQLNTLKKNGVRLAIDDFGTGYSSLSYLKNLPADKIKIDRSFILDIENDAYSREFVESIIKITRSVDRTVCIEGVETATQAQILKEMQADIFQGFLFGKPQPSGELETLFFNSQKAFLPPGVSRC